MSNTITLTLSVPITAQGRTLDTVTLRRPKVADLRRMDKRRGSDLEKTLSLIGDLAELTPDEVDEIDAKDLKTISQAVEDFTQAAG